jgi:hypothetical protein
VNTVYLQGGVVERYVYIIIIIITTVL